MTKYKMLAMMLMLAVAACKKEETPADPNAGSTARFKVTGVKDVDLSLSSTARASLQLQVVTNPGAQPDTVSLQVDGLPQGITTVFTPRTGKTSFSSKLEFINNFNGPGGNFPVNVVAIGNSGTMTYPMVLTVPGFIGWSFNDSVYTRTRIVKNNGGVSGYPYIYADEANGSRLIINFPYKAEFPTANKTYKIGASVAEGTLQLQFIRDSTQVFVSTATGSPTASFTFDTLGKFIFKCRDVKMSNGIRTGTLQVSMSE